MSKRNIPTTTIMQTYEQWIQSNPSMALDKGCLCCPGYGKTCFGENRNPDCPKWLYLQKREAELCALKQVVV